MLPNYLLQCLMFVKLDVTSGFVVGIFQVHNFENYICTLNFPQTAAWGRRPHTFKRTTHTQTPESALGEKETSLPTVYPDVSLIGLYGPRITSRDSQQRYGWISGIDDRESVHNFIIQTTGASEMISACFPNWTKS